jgi:hypothetical protein
MGSRWCGQVSARVIAKIHNLLTRELSTINHSSAIGELVHAIRIVKPKIIIADSAVLGKLWDALGMLEGRDHPIVLTMISREADCPLVNGCFLGIT